MPAQGHSSGPLEVTDKSASVYAQEFIDTHERSDLADAARNGREAIRNARVTRLGCVQL